MFNPFSMIFGWGRKIRKLRKRWDRLREKTLKKEPSMRARLLPREDQVEQNLRILEERRLNRSERARLAKEVEIDLAEIKDMVQASPEELQAAMARQAHPLQQQGSEKRKEEQQSSY
jgi:hypothetical protein